MIGFHNPSDKQISARIGRYPRLMRDQGLVRRLPNQNLYQKYFLSSLGPDANHGGGWLEWGEP